MTVPKIFHHAWLGGPIPEHLQAYVDTWHHHHPDWEFQFWHDENLPLLRNQRLYDDAATHAPGNIGQFRADLLRYELLLDYGGVWADTDLECLRPIDNLVNVDCFAAWEQQARWVGNTILGAVPGHPLLADLVEGVAANVRRRRGARPSVSTGPQYLTRVYRRHAKAVTVYSQSYFYSYLWSDLGTDREGFVHPDAYAVHHWNAQRCRLAAREVSR